MRNPAQKKSLPLQIKVGPERIVHTDGIQPFMFQSSKGTLFNQSQLSFAPGYVSPAKNRFPGLPGNVISRDRGATWKLWKPKPEQGEGPTIEGATVELKDGRILMFDWIADGPTAEGDFTGSLWESPDDCETFDGPMEFHIRLPEARGGFDDAGHPYSGLTFHRSVLQLPSGDLLAVIYCWFKGDDTPCPYQTKMCKFRTMLIRSSDAGRNWRYASTVAVDPAIGEEGFDEPVMIRLGKGPRAGRLLCIMRTGSIECPMYQCASDDEGRTWSAPRKLDFCGVDPDLIEMSDGTLVCASGWRCKGWGHASEYKGKRPPRACNYIVFSTDQGETWRDLTPFPFESHADPISTYYTTVREIGKGRLLVVYDIGFWLVPLRYVASRVVTVKQR